MSGMLISLTIMHTFQRDKKDFRERTNEIVPTTPSPLHFYSHPQSKHHCLFFNYFHSVSVRDGWREKVLWVMRIAQLSHGERNRKCVI
jgi:hypothetical protein